MLRCKINIKFKGLEVVLSLKWLHTSVTSINKISLILYSQLRNSSNLTHSEITYDNKISKTASSSTCECQRHKKLLVCAATLTRPLSYSTDTFHHKLQSRTYSTRSISRAITLLNRSARSKTALGDPMFSRASTNLCVIFSILCSCIINTQYVKFILCLASPSVLIHSTLNSFFASHHHQS